jgi:integrase
MTMAPPAALAARPHEDDRDPFVFHDRRLSAGWSVEETPRFSDDVWNLAPAMLKKHERRFILDFRLVQAAHRHVAKELCYGMLSGPAPPGEERPAVGTVRTYFTEYVRFLNWAGGRVSRLDALTGRDVEDYQRFLIQTLPAASARQGARAGARKFWLWRNTLPSGALRFDPQHADGWSEPKARGGENSTARIPEEVLGPLFGWAMRFIDEFSADILAADRQWRTPPPPSPEPHAYGRLPVLLRAWLDERVAAGQPLPAWRGKTSTTAIADALGRNRISLARYRHLIDEAAVIVGTAPQTVGGQPVRGRLDGRPWIAVILADHTERDSLAALARLLQDACYLVLAFLSGARDSEIKHLQRGGLTTERDADGTAYRWKMHSLAFKAENDPVGVPATWNIGEPAARAIAVLEQLQPPGTEYLFARLRHSPGSKPGAVSQVLTSGATNARLNAFAAWINDYCQRHGRADGIPLTGGQPWHLTNSQFRRTLAWFIARRPGGVIAGAMAYRHHCVQVFEGYAGTSESGFRAEVESEQALARGEHLMAAIDAHEHPSLTGPAADEAARRLQAFGERARFHGTVILDEARLRRLMARHDPAVYPGEYVTCVHDHAKALCEKARYGRESLPDHGGCKPLACRNVALTPGNTAAWQREIDRIGRRLAARRRRRCCGTGWRPAARRSPRSCPGTPPPRRPRDQARRHSRRGPRPPHPGPVPGRVPRQWQAPQRPGPGQDAGHEQYHLPPPLPAAGRGDL